MILLSSGEGTVNVLREHSTEKMKNDTVLVVFLGAIKPSYTMLKTSARSGDVDLLNIINNSMFSG
jgi:hypothetical protein